MFLIFNDKNIRKCKEVQKHKVFRLGKNSLRRNNPDKVIYNFSSVTLRGNDKSLLSTGLSFALCLLFWSIWNIQLITNCFFRDTLNLETTHLDCKLLKCRLKDIILSSFKTYNSSRKPNKLMHEEFQSLLKLRKHENVFIQKLDNDNSLDLIDKIVFTQMELKIFQLIQHSLKNSAFIFNNKQTFILDCEQKVINIINVTKKKEEIYEIQHQKNTPSG